MATAAATRVSAWRSHRLPLKDIADAEVRAAAFAADSVVQADGSERRAHPNAQSDSNLRAETGLGESLQADICVVSAPRIANVHEQDAFQPACQRLAQLNRP